MPSENEEGENFSKNLKEDGDECYGEETPYLLISLFLVIAILILTIVPYWQVDYQGINNNTERATLENQYRATLAQILGGAAIGITLYYNWRRIGIAEKDLKVTQKNLNFTQKIAQDNLKIAEEGQITERFTRAIEQLGNEKIEIRLGGIYSLERISNESEKDYRSIMDILTAYIRKNSPVKNESIVNKEDVPIDRYSSGNYCYRKKKILRQRTLHYREFSLCRRSTKKSIGSEWSLSTKN